MPELSCPRAPTVALQGVTAQLRQVERHASVSLSTLPRPEVEAQISRAHGRRPSDG
jgi:hypothetical protein